MTFYERSGEDIDRGIVGYWPLDDLKRIPSDGIVAHYKMNDNAASTDVIDSKGGNTGVSANNTDTMDVVGKINNALAFNGTTDRITIANRDDINFQNNGRFAISFWYRSTDGSVASDRVFLLKAKNGFFDSSGYSVRSFNATLFFRIENDDETSTASVTTTFTENVWEYFTFVYDGTNILLYKNGSLVDSEAFSDGVGDNTADLIFGDQTNYTAVPFSFDDVRFYDRALSLAEHQALYNSDSGTETTELFRDTIVAIDRANFNDGTITGATNTEGINGLNADAMFFDGVDDFVETTSVSGMGEIFSVSFWGYFNSFGGGGSSRIIYNNNTDLYILINDAGNRLTMTRGVSVVSAPDSVVLNSWNNYIITSDNGITNIYVNGVLSGTPDQDAGTARGTTGIYTIGSNNTHDRVVDGKLQNMRFYNRILTHGERSKIARLKL